MKNGWIKLQRGLLEHGIFQDGDLLRVWLYCLLQASYRQVQLPLGRQVIQLQPGQLLFGRKAVSQRLQMSEGQLRHIMQQLVELGSISVVSTNRYSIVTVVNWDTYQQENMQTAFPFDCDFLEDDGYPEDIAGQDIESTFISSLLQPAESQLEIGSGQGLADFENVKKADLQPAVSHKQEKNIQENNKKENKYNKNKRKQKIKKTTRHETKAEQEKDKSEKDREEKQKVKNNTAIIRLDSAAKKTQQNKLENACHFAVTDAAREKTAGKDQRNAGLEQPAKKEKRASVYLLAKRDTAAAQTGGMDVCYAHAYTMEMAKPNAVLSQDDVRQLERLFLQQKTGQIVVPTDPRTVDELAERKSSAALRKQQAVPIALHNQDIVFEKRGQNQAQVQEAREMFDRLWSQYPVQLGRHKIGDKQITLLAAEGEQAVEAAIRNYCRIKQGCAKQYWMHGSSFFNGGYRDYLPQAQNWNKTEVLWEGLI